MCNGLKILFWEATLRCNARCSFCGSRCGPQGGQELTTGEILAAFRSIAQEMESGSIMVNVTGGEPLLRTDLFHVMTQCRDMGFPWGMVTNGMLITQETVEQMRRAGMKTISVSLDGLEETHEQLRGVSGSFQKVVEAIRMLKEADFLEHIQVTTVVSRKNIHQLDALYDLMQELKPDSWRVAMVDGIGRAAGQEELLLGQEEVQTYLDFIACHQEETQPRIITSCSHYLGGHDDRFGRNPFQCLAGTHVASILANGDIFVCPNVPRRLELIQGNVKTHSLPQVWREGFQLFRDPDARKAQQCAHCADWSKCRGDSLHTWDFDNHRPGFCYRKFFPERQDAMNRDLNSILETLKARHDHLRGIHVRYGSAPQRKLVFTPDAAGELHRFFRWGTWHPANLAEQLVCLIGHDLADCTLVEFVSPVFLQTRSSTQAAFTQTSLQAAREEVHAINLHYLSDLCREYRLVEEHCKLLGFLHSHPAGLDLRLSEPDVRLHQMLLENQGLHWTVIVNPQKRQLAAYAGSQMELADILLLGSGEDAAAWQIQSP